jgi:F0F1-type ATP synthase membrane subunit c/vacuolar-type H+-ATPase subunit K
VDKLRAAYRVSVIIGLAIMASLLVYAILVGLFENGSIALSDTPALSGSGLEIMKFALLGASAVIFFVIRFVNARLLNAGGGRDQAIDTRPRPATGTEAEFGRLTTASIITYALCETPAIFGLVLYVLGRNSADFYLFLMASLFYFATNFPRFSQWEEWYRKQQPGQGMRRK